VSPEKTEVASVAEVDMERNEVIAVLDSLAEGSAQPQEVLAALHAASTLLRQSAARPAAAGARWTDDEDAQLCREFDDATPVAEIAKTHNRSAAAINLRLVKLGRLEAESVKARRR
jgi:hypothetical protein